MKSEEAALKKKEKRKKKVTSLEHGQLQEQLKRYFQVNVQFMRSEKGKGKIVLEFNSDEDLEKILAKLDQIK